MPPVSPRSTFLALAAGLALFPSGHALAGNFAGLSLSVSKETAPPGALAQMKVSVTEPKPISTGRANMEFTAYEALLGIALSSPADDAAGVALVRGASLELQIVSPSGTYGTGLDYPILTVTGRVPADTPLGTKFPLDLDPAALQLADASGTLYPVEVRPGHLVAGSGVAIGDVTPGSASVPAGSVVTLTGANFEPGTRVKIAEGKLEDVIYVSPSRIDVVVAQPTVLHGLMFKASNPDGSKSTYFSYQRTRPTSPSADPVLQFAVPLPPPAEVTGASVALPAPAPGTTYGLAVQNIEPAEALVAVELLDESGAVLGNAELAVPQNRFAVRELGELFGVVPSGPATLRVTSATPVQVLGLAADQAAGTATPILAQ